jgi:RNA polymerase sigma-70 factor (ECF subfamily)
MAISGRSVGEGDFAARVEAHRRDLLLLCYRMTGSLHDAEEAVQETAFRAWRTRASFRGESSLRTWLHRIATRVCLDQVGRRRRTLPTAVGSTPADPAAPPDPPNLDIAWLEPLPDEELFPSSARMAGALDETADPLAHYTLRESVSLAFLAALQSLPPRQRAVLILRDVLGWSAAEAAETLEVTIGSANSALHRARRTLEAGPHVTGLDAMSIRRPADPKVRTLLDAYVRAWETDDIDALVATLREDARLAMPPTTSWYTGRRPIGVFLRRWVLGAGAPRRFRLTSTRANGGPAVIVGERGPRGAWSAIGVMLFAVEPDGIADIVVFMDPAIAARFAAT